MRKRAIVACALAGVFVLCTRLAVAADSEVTASQVVEAIEGIFGVTPGERRNHIKGTCAIGEFVGSKEAVRYTRSALFSGKAVSVVARFSLAGGNPKLPDTAKNPRGMAQEGLNPLVLSQFAGGAIWTSNRQ